MKELNDIKNDSLINIIDYSKSGDGIKGYVNIRKKQFVFIMSWGMGWEHLSVSHKNINIIPSWDEMNYLKNIFFKESETTIQIHPNKNNYINNRTNCLHMWRPIKETLPLPSVFMV